MLASTLLFALGAVLELTKKDGTASRIDFGVGPDGPDSSLAGNAHGINASVPFHAPNIEALTARIAALEALLASVSLSADPVTDAPVLTFASTVVVTGGLALEGGFNETALEPETRRRLEETAGGGATKDVLRIRSKHDAADAKPVFVVNAKGTTKLRDSKGKERVRFTAGGASQCS
jgi:hypothetical protein